LESFLLLKLASSALDFCNSLWNLELPGGNFFWSFSPKHAADAAYDAAHGEDSFIIHKKNLAYSAAAVVPALEQGEMLHGFERRRCFLGGNESRTPCTRDSMDCDFACSAG
jgi:hypothetical protein